MLMELHTQSKKEINMGKLSYPQKLKYLEPLPILYPLLQCNFFKTRRLKKPQEMMSSFLCIHWGRGGADRKKEKLLAPKNAGLCIRVQTVFPLSEF